MTTVNSPMHSSIASYKTLVMKIHQNSTESVKLLHLRLKQQKRSNSINAVSTYNEYIQSLLSIHKENKEVINWEVFLREPQPKLPVKEMNKQFEAEYNYQTYEPTLLDYLTLQHKKKIREFLDKIELAKQEDDLIYNAALKAYRSEAQDWKKIQVIARGVIEEDPLAYKSAIDLFEPFAAVSLFGSKTIGKFFSDHITVNLYVNANTVVPDYVLSISADHTLSAVKMSMPAYHQLLQNYICGCALKIARESFALLPIGYMIVNVLLDLFNTTTGFAEAKVVLSARFEREQLDKLDFGTVDCPQLITNFIHRMEFTKNDGFVGITAIVGEYDQGSPV